MTLIIRRISSLSPLCERIRTTSPLRIDPRSPCRASAGFRKWLGVPVLLNDADNFLCDMPRLPDPARPAPTPWQSTMSRTARKNDSSRRGEHSAHRPRFGFDHLTGKFQQLGIHATGYSPTVDYPASEIACNCTELWTVSYNLATG